MDDRHPGGRRDAPERGSVNGVPGGIPPSRSDGDRCTQAQLLSRVSRSLGDRIEPVVERAIDRVARLLFLRAEDARAIDAHVMRDALRHLDRRGADLLPELLGALQREAEALRRAPGAAIAPTTPEAWRLLDDHVVAEQGSIAQLAGSLERVMPLPLYLLGERLGALLGCSPLAPQALPIGPHALLRCARDAARAIDAGHEVRVLLLHEIAREARDMLPACIDLANVRLRAAGVLPELAGYRSRPHAAVPDPSHAESTQARTHAAIAASDATVALRDTRRASGDATNTATSPASADVARPWRPFDAWLDLARADDAPANDGDAAIFDVMRHLLGGRRALLGRTGDTTQAQRPEHPVGDADVQRVLRALQHAPCDVAASVAPQTLRHALDVGLGVYVPPGHRPALEPRQTDTVELMDMLFEHLLRDVPPQCTGANLLARLRVPLLRAALQDKGFFARRQQPARRLLDTLADAAMYWLDGDADFAAALSGLVDDVVQGFDGDMAVFEDAASRLKAQLDERTRRAALIERRHVEAERGRERLELARRSAREAMARLTAGQVLPDALAALLSGAWADALALAASREGVDGVLFRQRVDAAAAIVDHCAQRSAAMRSGAVLSVQAGDDASTSTEHGGMSRAADDVRRVFEEGLCQLGHSADMAAAMLHDALCSTDAGATVFKYGDSVVCAQPEQADSLRKMRVATDSESPRVPSAACVVDTGISSHAISSDEANASLDDIAEPPLDATARTHLERLRRLPFGTWFDLAIDGGRCERCRMSWFSPVTGRCLFVNARGQRVGDRSLHWLARQLSDGSAALVREAQGSVVDAAWQAILGMLRVFSSPQWPATAPA